MKLTLFRLGGALLVPLLVLPVALSAPAQARPAPHPPHTAADIGGFLTDFYGDHGPSAPDREARVSQVLKDRQLASADADVLLCAQNEPRDISIGPVTVAQVAGIGWATVTTHWDAGVTDTFTAYVRLDSEPIHLDDVICAG